MRTLAVRARRRTIAALWLLTASILGSDAHLTAQTPTPNEYRLKAAFVYQFPGFVDWPSREAERTGPAELCVLAPNRFGTELEQLVRGESLGGRELVVRTVGSSDSIRSCRILFVTGASERAGAALAEASRLPILTIGEADSFLADGGIIVLKLIDRRIRFEVNVANAKRAGLRVSSQLLALAQRVVGGPS